MSYQLTSTMIDDEELIEELKKYGENLPMPGSNSKRKSINQLTEKNREIYLKKLNHYKAREKAESNPSKYLKQQHQNTINSNANTPSSSSAAAASVPTSTATSSSGSLRSSSTSSKRQSTRASENNTMSHDDFIDLTQNDSRAAIGSADVSEYIQMANAGTSPLSSFQTTPANMNANSEPMFGSSTSSATAATTAAAVAGAAAGGSMPLKELNYVSLKERIEIDRTLSKYRNDIHDILNRSKINSAASKFINDENAYGARRTINSKLMNEDNDVEIIDSYCPKQTKKNSSFFDVFKPSYYLNKSSSSSTTTTSSTSSNTGIRLVPSSSRTNEAPKRAQPSPPDVEYLSPVKEEEAKSRLTSTVSNLGLQVSKVLPYLVIIIFTVIVLQYIRMRVASNNQDAKNSNYSPSDSSSIFWSESWFPFYSNEKSFNFCPDIKDVKCSQTKTVVKELIDYLRSRSGAIDCLPSLSNEKNKMHPTIGHMTIDSIEKCVHLNQVIDFLNTKKKYLFDAKHQQVAIDSMLKAILRNPQWNIQLFNESYMETNDPEEVTYMMSSVSAKPFMCRATELMQTVLTKGLMVFSAIITVVLGYFLVSLYNKNRVEKSKTFYNLVGQAVSMVEKQYELHLLDPANIKPYIAISHIYDSLFEPSLRASQKQQWNNVIKFIADHESRIHLETQFIDGEETQVWKWIVPKAAAAGADPKLATSFQYGPSPTCGFGLANSTMLHPPQMQSPHIYAHQQQSPTSLASSPNQQQQMANGWQGDAFAKSDKVIYSPTPCLKIRNMFDPTQFDMDPMLASKIHNDILDKCSAFGKLTPGLHCNQSILHIACDKKSKEGCVYVKCASNESAGICYQALNGTWYNGKLLNVKYLRMDRYLERFPESKSYVTPVQRMK